MTENKLSFTRILIYLSGLLLSSIGISLSLKSSMGISSWDTVFDGFSRLPIDGLMISLNRFFKITITKSRFFIESLGFAISILLKAPIGIGTIIITFTMAPLI